MRAKRNRYEDSNVFALLFLSLAYGLSCIVCHSGTLFSDDFADGDLAGWEDGGKSWTVANGQVRGVGGWRGQWYDGFMYAGEQSWTDYTFKTTVLFEFGQASLFARSSGEHWQNEYRIDLWNRAVLPDYPNHEDLVSLIRYKDGVPTELLRFTSPVHFGDEVEFSITLSGSAISLAANSTVIRTITDADPLLSGRIGLGVIWDTSVRFDNVFVEEVQPDLGRGEALAGIWSYSGAIAGDAPMEKPGWYRGEFTLDAHGIVSASSPVSDSLGNNSFVPSLPAFSVDLNGSLSVGNGLLKGLVNRANDVMVLTGTMCPGASDAVCGHSLLIGVKGGADDFVPDDLAGTWHYLGLATGDRPNQNPGWYRGAHTLNASGTATSSSPVTDSRGNSNYVPTIPPVSITSDGAVSIGGVIKGFMGRSRDLIVLTGSLCPGDSEGVCGYCFMVWAKQGMSDLTTADLAGQWAYHGLACGDSTNETPGWYRGEFSIDDAGQVTDSSPIVDSDGNSTLVSTLPPFSLSLDGLVQSQGGTLQGVMTSTKDIMLMAGTLSPASADAVTGFDLILWVREPVVDSAFRIISIVRESASWRITFTTDPGFSYQVEFCDALNDWGILQDNILGDGQLKSIADSVSSSQRFYRVVRSPGRSSLVWIPPGEFTMGSLLGEMGRDSNEGPQRNVTITGGFWMGRYEVTQAEYTSVMGNNPSYFKGDSRLPVESLTWFQVMDYCANLNAQERAAGRLPQGYAYRLPTEAEWEYACRAGTSSRFSFGDDLEYLQLGDFAWFSGNSGSTSHPVGERRPNPWGLCDMTGNVWERCQDWYALYDGPSAVDPTGPASGSDRVYRGGGWDVEPRLCRSAMRGKSAPSDQNWLLGFRVVLAPQ